MTENSVDRILDIIDTGLQTPAPDPSFGEVSPPNVEGCARCGAPPADEGGDFCAGCRAFLLGDSDTDPATPQGGGEITPAPAGCRCALCTGEFAQQILDSADAGAPWRDEMARQWTVDLVSDEVSRGVAAGGAAAMAAWLARASDWLADTVARPDANPRARARADRRSQTVVYRRTTGDTRPGPLIPDMAEGDLITFDGQYYTVVRIISGEYGSVVDIAPVGPQGITPPDPPDPDTLARAREREILANLRRSQRRTNRW